MSVAFISLGGLREVFVNVCYSRLLLLTSTIPFGPFFTAFTWVIRFFFGLPHLGERLRPLH